MSAKKGAGLRTAGIFYSYMKKINLMHAALEKLVLGFGFVSRI